MAAGAGDRPAVHRRKHPALFAEVRRAMAEFLGLPTAVIVGFVLLAGATYAVDRSRPPWIEPLLDVLEQHLFADARATAALLGTVAGSIITVTSITFSLLLLAVQQSAASLTSEVFDQFLRRRLNQVYFGFFIGLALYSLLVLATVDRPFNPVFGATLALVLTVGGLYLLILLIYGTIDQMRPSRIIDAIHDHILAARQCQLGLLGRTRRAPRSAGGPEFGAATDGFVTGIDVEAIERAVAPRGGEAEVVLLVSIGEYVAYRDPVAMVCGTSAEAGRDLEAALRGAIHIERRRDVETDPGYGIVQLETIGWTSISTSKQNPAPGLLAIQALRDILARWSAESAAEASRAPGGAVVYRDNVPEQVMRALESLVVVASESMQHQSLAEAVTALAALFGRLTPGLQASAEGVLVRSLSGLGDHVLTADLADALEAAERGLEAQGRRETAGAIRLARRRLAGSAGQLNSRATRVPPD